MEAHDRHRLVELVEVRRSRKFVIAAVALCLLFAGGGCVARAGKLIRGSGRGTPRHHAPAVCGSRAG